ncbi:MAG: hypothetical protein ABI230_07160 [Aestuariivirga sp.]
MRKFLVSGFAAFAFATAAHADGLMTGAEVLQLAPAHYHVVAPGVTIEVDLGLKGKISVVTDKGEKDKGRWHLNGDRFCVKFTKLLDRQEHCELLNRAGDQIKGNVLTATRR